VATVERHVSNILAKLGLATRSQVALWAVQHGMEADRNRAGVAFWVRSSTRRFPPKDTSSVTRFPGLSSGTFGSG
jgi:hypothetical protein